MQAFGVILALIFGFITWGIVFAIAGSNPVGRVGGLEIALFLSPLMGMLGPAVLKALDARDVALAAWLIALGPVVGSLNIVLFIVIVGVTHGNPDGWSPVFVLANVIWFVPALLRLWRNAKMRGVPKERIDGKK